MGEASNTDLRNKVGGFLFGFSGAAFCIFLAVVERWTYSAPTTPDRALRQLYVHNEHGWITYFTAFQATSNALMFLGTFLTMILAFATLPRREMKVRRWGGLPLAASWKSDDQKGLAKSSAVYGVVAAPLVIFLFGPMIVGWLNSHGIVINL